MSVVDVTSSNWSSGTGVIDSYNSLITDIKNAHDEDKGVAAVEIGVAAVGAVIDTVSTILNPLSKLIAAGLGWLIEHVEFLKKPLDWLAGNPDGIAALANQLHQIGQDLRNTATDMDGNLKSTVTQWTGTAADNFHDTISGRQNDIDAAGHSVDIAGYVVETTMALISAVRNLIRDMITSTLGDIISTMIIALASAAFTFGASIVAGVAKCVVEGVAKVAEMTAKIAKLLGFSARTVKRIDDLVSVLRKTATEDSSSMHTIESDAGGGHAGDEGPGTPSGASAPHDTPADTTPSETAPSETTPSETTPSETTPSDTPHADETPAAAEDTPSSADDSVYQDWLNADQHFNPDEHTTPSSAGDAAPHGADDTPADTAPSDASPADPPPAEHAPAEATPAPAPAPKTGESLLKPFDHPNLKLHEDWLKNNGFGGDLDKVKFNENFLKKNYPDLYTTLKTISDLKSSKNMVGLTDKYVLQAVKQLADIQQKAQMSWDQANTQWQQEHPDQQPPAQS
jgi:hypothetical protein